MRDILIPSLQTWINWQQKAWYLTGPIVQQAFVYHHFLFAHGFDAPHIGTPVQQGSYIRYGRCGFHGHHC